MALSFLSFKANPHRFATYENGPLVPRKYCEVYDRHRSRGKKGKEAVVKMMDKLATDLFFILYGLEQGVAVSEACETTQSKTCTAPRPLEESLLQTLSP